MTQPAVQFTIDATSDNKGSQGCERTGIGIFSGLVAIVKQAIEPSFTGAEETLAGEWGETMHSSVNHQCSVNVPQIQVAFFNCEGTCTNNGAIDICHNKGGDHHDKLWWTVPMTPDGDGGYNQVTLPSSGNNWYAISGTQTIVWIGGLDDGEDHNLYIGTGAQYNNGVKSKKSSIPDGLTSFTVQVFADA